MDINEQIRAGKEKKRLEEKKQADARQQLAAARRLGPALVETGLPFRELDFISPEAVDALETFIKSCKRAGHPTSTRTRTYILKDQKERWFSKKDKKQTFPVTGWWISAIRDYGSVRDVYYEEYRDVVIRPDFTIGHLPYTLRINETHTDRDGVKMTAFEYEYLDFSRKFSSEKAIESIAEYVVENNIPWLG